MARTGFAKKKGPLEKGPGIDYNHLPCK